MFKTTRVLVVALAFTASLLGLGANTASAADPSETITYLHNDLAGSPIAATDDTGILIWKEHYFSYGDRLSNQSEATGNRQWFHGKPVDSDTGLSYFGARYYDATLGRFMGVDPQGFDEGNIQSFNRYAYGNNNPYRFVDPDGKAALDLAIGATVLYVGSVIYARSPETRALVDRVYKAVPNVFRSDSAGSKPEPKGDSNKGAESAAPPNLSPEGSGRSGAFNEAKRGNGVHTSQSPDRVLPNEDRRGNRQPGCTYEFDVPASGSGTTTVGIGDDADGHNFGEGNSQNRGPHFNDAAGNHYDY